MPGIVGIVSRRPSADCERLVSAMVASMRHEVFYASGTHSAPELGVYAGWIAHSGSFAQRESIGDGSHSVDVSMAGECYTDEGHPSIAALYRAEDERFVAQLNGLFSGLVIDRLRGRTLLFNDRFGLERLYVHEAKDALYFASEAKALLQVLPELRAFDDRGVGQFLTFGSTQHWTTLYRDVHLMEGGSVWSFEGRACRKQRYFTPSEWEAQPTLSAREFQKRLDDTFRAIVPRYLAGARVGISLTGGLDTRMIMACLPALPHPPISYTFSAEGAATLDERLAARVASALGLKHVSLRVGREFLAEFGRHVDRSVFVTDACAGATSAHELYLNAQARRLAPARLTGNFGSEVLRDMSTFKPIGLDPGLIHADFQRVVASTVDRSEAQLHPVTFAAFREVPWNLIPNVAAGRSQLAFRTPFLDNDVVALAFQAPTVSRRSPESALRFVLNNRPSLARIPTDRGWVVNDRGPGHVLRRLFAELTFKLDYMHSDGLPHVFSRLQPLVSSLSLVGLLGRHKFLSYRRWFQRELAPYIREVLTDPRTARSHYWNRAFLASLADDHINGRNNRVHEIHAVMTLEAAQRLLIEQTATSASEHVFRSLESATVAR